MTTVTTVETFATGSIERLRRKSESGVVFPKQERDPRDGVGPWRGAEIVKVCFFLQSLLFFALVLVSSGGTRNKGRTKASCSTAGANKGLASNVREETRAARGGSLLYLKVSPATRADIE